MADRTPDRTADTDLMLPHERSGLQVDSSAEGEAEPSRGDTIGRFLVLGVLGSGGMGVVYSAYDPHLDRKVALKLLHTDALARPGNVRTRLLREAQAMARIDHPNVIKVHEVGTHGAGVYVAMEFAEAGTVRTWLTSQTRSRAEIIAVYLQAGRGLAAAHTAGLIHRDFKPDNVLMTKGGVVRVTDFGLVSEQDAQESPTPTEPFERPPEAGTRASALSLDLTRTGSMVGTPPYMAPEQFKTGVASARSDQFSFCVALYEALYGARPFAGTTFEEVSANVTAGQFTEPPTKINLPGWLRRILLRGLATEPEARYPSMTALLAELSRDGLHRRRRYLAWASVPVLAVAAATTYALWPSELATCRAGGERFGSVWNAGKRHQLEGAFLATGRPHAPATFAKVAGVLDAWGHEWQQGYIGACEDTHVRGEHSEHVLDLRMDCLARGLDQTRATLGLLSSGGGDTVDHALDAVLQLPRVATCADVMALEAAVPPPETPQQRAQVAGVRSQLDEVNAESRLGRVLAARDLATSALGAARATGYRPIVADALTELGSLQLELADPVADATLREAMRVATEAGDPGRQLEATAWFVFAMSDHHEKFELGLELAALAEASTVHARPRPDSYMRLEVGLARIDQGLGKLADAQATLEKSITFSERALGSGAGIETARSMLGVVFVAEGKFDEARRLLERSIEERKRLYGPDHPAIAVALTNLAIVYRRQGQLEEAQQLDDRALAIRIAAYGPDHPEVGTSYHNMGNTMMHQGDPATAESYFRKALAVWVKIYGPEDIKNADAYDNLGCALMYKGDLEGARAELEHSLKIYEAAGPETISVATPLSHLADLESRAGHLDHALELYHRAEDITTRTGGSDHPDLADYYVSEATLLRHQHKLVPAQAALERGIALLEKAYGPDHAMVGKVMINLGNLDAERDDAKGALAAYQRSATILEARLGKHHPLLASPLLGISNSLATLGRRGEATPYLEQALVIQTANKAPAGALAEIHFGLAGALFDAPKTRARAINEAHLALDQMIQANRADDAAEIRRWLAKHHL